MSYPALDQWLPRAAEAAARVQEKGMSRELKNMLCAVPGQENIEAVTEK